MFDMFEVCCSTNIQIHRYVAVLQHSVSCLRYVAVPTYLLQCLSERRTHDNTVCCRVLHDVAVCCGVLQCVAVCCSARVRGLQGRVSS